MKVKRIVLISLMAVLICVCSWATVPIGSIPFTLQTFAVFCALILLGGIDGTISIFLYLVLGMIGIPVFSSFRGGVGHILGPTGGYLIGFIATGVSYLVFEIFTKNVKGNKKIIFEVISLVIGLLLCYLVGTIWFYFVSKGADYTFGKVLMLCVVPYIIPDIIKLILAVVISRRLKKVIFKEESDYE